MKILYQIILLGLVSFFPLTSIAGNGIPTCHTTSSGSEYCAYTGLVKKIYVNSGNLVLIFFENPVDITDAQNHGFAIGNTNAAAFKISDNPEFIKLFYSTALSAQATNRSVNIQMRGVESGYLKFDRISLNAN